MTREPTPRPVDPLAVIDGVKQLAEVLRGAVAVLTDDGWTDEHARLIVLRAFVQGSDR